MAKVKCAWFDFASCEGCQIELTNYGEPFVQLLENVEPVEFREAMSEKTTEPIDVAFIEGSFTREADRRRLEDIRRRASVVVAYGACAACGGINALKNHQDDYAEAVYGDDKDRPHLNSQKALPISAAIKVDYEIPGCPMDKAEFIRIVTQLVKGTAKVYVPSYPVCMECKRNGTLCRYDDGDHCLGPVALAGCNAPCPAAGIPCEACRGMVKDANQDAMEKVLIENGELSEQRAKTKSRMFTANFRGDA
ncbi:MAG: NADH:ubiquinone oxidoreductase [Verrucomicrobia bacterium]|jgi:sulfhydrogenase subunit delta|nr:NADH:ubiquinone oxidoreductase [Verrucomicrobiota bacterium]